MDPGSCSASPIQSAMQNVMHPLSLHVHVRGLYMQFHMSDMYRLTWLQCCLQESDDRIASKTIDSAFFTDAVVPYGPHVDPMRTHAYIPFETG